MGSDTKETAWQGRYRMNLKGRLARFTARRMKTIPSIPTLFAVSSALVLVAAMLAMPIPVSAAFLNFKGNAIAIATDKIALETPDGSILTLRTNQTSRFMEKGKPIKLGQLREGDHLDVDVVQDPKGGFVIVEARLLARSQVDENAGPPKLARRPAGSQPATAPRSDASLNDAPRPDVPLSESASAPPDRSARSIPDEGIPRSLTLPDRPDAPDRPYARRTSTDPKMELVDRARYAAAEFSEKLPNYVCQQQTTRYISETRPANWRAQDVVSAAVVYENGREDYRNITVNGHAVNKKMDEIGGSTSTGEFATILLNLFHPATDANFKWIKESVSSRMTTAVYDFSVTQPHSAWEIHVEGQHVLPAYTGTVWIDTNTARVMRIEMEARPADFPIDMIQTAVDYDFVSLGTDRYLLPTRSESISCERGSPICSRNVIDFRNYHKYLGESKIIFDTPK
jgi:hypothetical protein